LKPQNILLDPQTMTIKIADFGLSRLASTSLRTYTNEVVTLWYRAPELLLGTEHYSYPIDMWSIALIFIELWNKRPFLPGHCEIDQLYRIFQQLGTPNETSWPGVSRLSYSNLSTFPYWRPQPFRSMVPGMDQSGTQLLCQLLQYEPRKRLTCKEALQCDIFKDIEIIKEKARKAGFTSSLS
jgi:serine/threonine protein kinase